MPPYINIFVEPLKDSTAQNGIAVVMALMLLDLLIGIIGAVATKTFDSSKMRDGLLHKFTELVAIALAVILDGALLGGLQLSVQPLLIATCVYVGIMETGSVIELIKKYNPEAEGLVGWLTAFVMDKDKQGGANGNG